MNKIYKLVFSKSLGQFIVTSEQAKGRTKSSKLKSAVTGTIAAATVIFSATALADPDITVDQVTGNKIIGSLNTVSGSEQTLIGSKTTVEGTGNNVIASANTHGSIKRNKRIVETFILANGLKGTSVETEAMTAFNALIDLYDRHVKGEISTTEFESILNTPEYIEHREGYVGAVLSLINTNYNPDEVSQVLVNVVKGSENQVVGSFVDVRGHNNVAIGTDVSIHQRNLDSTYSNVDDAIAIGTEAHVSANNGIAIGSGATTTHEGSVAIGAGSQAKGQTLNQAAYLSGGTATGEANFGNRRLTGLAAGATDSDAATVGQLKKLGQTIKLFEKDALITGQNNIASTLGVRGEVTTTTIAPRQAPESINFGSLDLDIATAYLLYNHAYTPVMSAYIPSENLLSLDILDQALATGDYTALENNVELFIQGFEAAAGNIPSNEMLVLQETLAEKVDEFFTLLPTRMDYLIAQEGMTSSAAFAQALSEYYETIPKEYVTQGIGIIQESVINGDQNVAFGYAVNVEGDNNIALGTLTTVTADDGVAVGNGASVTANKGVAIGKDASVTHEGSVAIGSGSVADGTTLARAAKFVIDTPDTVAKGEVNFGQRRLTGVASGSDDTDAVNVAQLQAVNNKVDALSGADSWHFIKGKLNQIELSDVVSSASTLIGHNNKVLNESKSINVIGQFADISHSSDINLIGSFQRATDVDRATIFGFANSVQSGKVDSNIGDVIAIGTSNQIKSSQSTAIGNSNDIKAQNSFAIGNQNNVGTAPYQTSGGLKVIGESIVADGLNQTVLGSNFKANGRFNTVISNGSDLDLFMAISKVAKDNGLTEIANAFKEVYDIGHAIAAGGSGDFDAEYARIIGAVDLTPLSPYLNNFNYNINSIDGNLNNVIATRVSIAGEQNNALGIDLTSFGIRTNAIGSDVSVNGIDLSAMGTGLNISGAYSSAIGFNSTSKGNSNSLMGNQLNANGNNNHLAGNNLAATGRNNTVLGSDTSVNGRSNTVLAHAFTERRVVNGFNNGLPYMDREGYNYYNEAGSYAMLEAANDILPNEGVYNFASQEEMQHYAMQLEVTLSGLSAEDQQAFDSKMVTLMDEKIHEFQAREQEYLNQGKTPEEITDIFFNEYLAKHNAPYTKEKDVLVRNSTVTGDNAVAMGAGVLVDANNAVAIGTHTTVTAQDAIAIGTNAEASHAGSIALGSNSVADGTTLNDVAFLVGGTAQSELNIGNRRITGVAAGANDFDAVNVAQLKVVHNQIADINEQIENLDVGGGEVDLNSSYNVVIGKDITHNIPDTEASASNIIGNKNQATNSSKINVLGSNNTATAATKTNIVGVDNNLNKTDYTTVLGDTNNLNNIGAGFVAGRGNTVTGSTTTQASRINITGLFNEAVYDPASSSAFFSDIDIYGSSNKASRSDTAIVGGGNNIRSELSSTIGYDNKVGLNNNYKSDGALVLGSTNTINGANQTVIGSNLTVSGGSNNSIVNSFGMEDYYAKIANAAKKHGFDEIADAYNELNQHMADQKAGRITQEVLNGYIAEFKQKEQNFDYAAFSPYLAQENVTLNNSIAGWSNQTLAKNVSVKGDFNVDVGTNLYTKGDANTLLGKDIGVTGSNNAAIGSSVFVSDSKNVSALGHDLNVKGNQSTLIGGQLNLKGNLSSIFGFGSTSTGSQNNALGNGLSIEGDKNALFGNNLSVVGQNNTTLGSDTTVDGKRNVAITQSLIRTDTTTQNYTGNPLISKADFNPVETVLMDIQLKMMNEFLPNSGLYNFESQESLEAYLAQAEIAIENASPSQLQELNEKFEEQYFAAMDGINTRIATLQSQGKTSEEIKDILYAEYLAKFDESYTTETEVLVRNSSVKGNDVVAMGSGVLVDANQAVAIGANATVTAVDGVAIGTGASVSHAGSVAIGAGSVANGETLELPAYLVGGTATGEANFGNRRLTGVSAGSSPTDAVNVSQLTNVQQSVDLITGRVDAVENDLITLQEQGSANIQAEINALGDRVTTAEGGISDLKTDVGTVQTDLGAVQTDLGDLTDRVGVNEGNITDLQTDVGTVKTDLGDLDTRVGVNEGNITDLKTDVGTVKTDLGAVQTDLGDLDTRVGVNEENITELKTDVGTVKTDLGAVQTDLGDLDTRVGVNEGNITDLQTDVGTVKTDLGDLDTRVGVNEENITELKTDVGNTKTDIGNLQTDLGGLDTRVGVNEGNITALDEAFKGHQTVFNYLNDHAVQYSSNEGTPNFNLIELKGAGGTIIRNVARAEDDSDAVNFGLLKEYTSALETRIESLEGGNIDLTQIEHIINQNNQTVLDQAKDYADEKAEEAKDYADEKDAENLELAKDYADQKDAENLELAKDYADDKAEEAKDYADEKDADNLELAKDYADQKDTENLELAKDYADGKAEEAKDYADQLVDGLELGVSKEYVDQRDAETLTDAKDYTDQVVRDLELGANTEYLDSQIETAKDHADQKAADAEENAKDYADQKDTLVLDAAKQDATDKASTAEQNAKDYADQKDALVLDAAKQDATDKANAAEQKANTYTDNRVTESLNLSYAYTDAAKTESFAYTDLKTTQTLNEAKAYADKGDIATLQAAKDYTDERINSLESAFKDSRDEHRAGIASALAIGNMPQPTMGGANMVSMGVGTFQGESAIAVGFSAVTDDPKYVFKFGGSADSRNNVSGAASVGFQWK